MHRIVTTDIGFHEATGFFNAGMQCVYSAAEGREYLCAVDRGLLKRFAHWQ